VVCLARAVAEHPHLNSLHKGHKLFLLDDVAVGTRVERNVEGERIAEPCSIRAADKKTYRQVHDEIRAAQRKSDESPGAISGLTWVRYIPTFLLHTFIRAESRNVRMAKRYGVVGVTNVGMFGDGPAWGVPLILSTVAVTVGGVASRPVMIEGGLEAREHLCLTISFDHDIIDGAPAEAIKLWPPVASMVSSPTVKINSPSRTAETSS
jgi:hypothetical protein